MSALVSVPFQGGELLAVAGEYPEEGERPIPLRPFCDRLGLTIAPQLVKLKEVEWAVVSKIDTTGSDGKTYEMACLPLRAIPMWLATMNPKKVAPEARAMLVAFQKEAADALYRHFRQRMEAAPVSGLQAPLDPGEAPPWFQKWNRDIMGRLMALEGKVGPSDHDGQIGPERAGVIRRQLVVFGQLMGHGDPKAAKSWRTMGDNELRDRLGHHRSKGRPWARLPVGRYGEALAKLEEMLTRARKVDVAHLEASQLPLKAS